MLRLLFMTLLTFSMFPRSLSPNHAPRLVVWNVGQGQLVTLSHSQFCWHFDMGGEHYPHSGLFAECGQKKNYVSYSHWDWDHINFTRKALKTFDSLCMVHAPLGPSTLVKRRFLARLSPCPAPRHVTEALQLSTQDLQRWTQRKKSLSLSNLSSRIFVVQERVLIPGDGPKEAEKTWIYDLRQREQIHYLIVGHHGSRSSTSRFLLKSLAGLKSATVSARKKRYGHPHPMVKKRLQERGVPLLMTESWGHVIWPLPLK